MEYFFFSDGECSSGSNLTEYPKYMFKIIIFDPINKNKRMLIIFQSMLQYIPLNNEATEYY